MKKSAAKGGSKFIAQGRSGSEIVNRKQPSLLFVHFLMLFASTLVSSSFIVGKHITVHLDPVLLTFVRFLSASCLFAPWVLWRHGLCFSFSLILRCAVISACLVVFFSCMFLSLRYTSALNTSVLFALVPSISGLYAFFIMGERLRSEQLLALGCGIIGVVWVIFKGELQLFLAMQWNKGDLIFLGGCFTIALYTPLVKLLHKDESMEVMTFWILVTGTMWLSLFCVGKSFSTDWTAVPWMVWYGVLYLSVFTTIITFFLTQYSVGFLGPTQVSAYSYLYPGLLIILNLCLGQGLPPLKVIPGVLVILAAMFVLQQGNTTET